MTRMLFQVFNATGHEFVFNKLTTRLVNILQCYTTLGALMQYPKLPKAISGSRRCFTSILQVLNLCFLRFRDVNKDSEDPFAAPMTSIFKMPVLFIFL